MNAVTNRTEYRINSENPGPHLLITAGVHGDEYEPMVAAVEMVRELPKLLISGSVTVVPIVNPSAYRQGSRLGEDQLDLARICPGDPEGSPSLRSAYEISNLIKEADYVIDMHTGGLALDIFPLAGFLIHPQEKILQQQRKLALACNLPVIWGTDHRPDGRTLSIARDASIPGIYLEFGGGAGFRKEVVNTYKEALFNVLRHLKMVTGPEVTLPEEERFWVEDSRPDSGFFQGKMPSPLDGIFVSCKMPGDFIEKGEPFGQVIDPYSGTPTAILAGMDGRVLSVRIAVKVKRGDALGALLPISQPGKIIIN